MPSRRKASRTNRNKSTERTAASTARCRIRAFTAAATASGSRLNAIQDKHWKVFCEVVDREAWKDRGADLALVPEMEKLFLDAPAAYWEALAGSRELCLFRVVPWEEHLSFSQARPQLSTDPLTWAGFAPNQSLGKTPALGEDTYAVLHSMGLSNKEISDWVQAGVLSNAKPA